MVEALGKRSIASALALILTIAKWVVALGLFAVLTILSFTLLIAFFGEGFSSIGWLEAMHDNPWPAGALHLLGEAIGLAVMLYVIGRLTEIAATLRDATPFVRENAERFTRVAAAIAIGEAARYGILLIGAIAARVFYAGEDFNIDIDIELDVWFAVLVILVLAAVFREGARLKEEQDLTV